MGASMSIAVKLAVHCLTGLLVGVVMVVVAPSCAEAQMNVMSVDMVNKNFLIISFGSIFKVLNYEKYIESTNFRRIL